MTLPFSRYAALTLLSVAAVGCAKKTKQDAAPLVTEQPPAKSFLAAVPADTPYAFAALEPAPLGPIIGWMERWGGYVEQAMGGVADTVLQDEYAAPESKAMFALLREMGGKYSPEGLESMGFSRSPRMAVYGIGPLPAFRLDVKDPELIQQLVARVEKASGLKRVSETLDETDFWTYQTNEGFIVMALIDRELVVGATPREAAATYIEYLLGAKSPAKTMADENKLRAVVDEYGFEPFGVGYVDLHEIASMVFKTSSGLNGEIASLVDDAPSTLPPECQSEIRSILDAAPRVVMGFDEWSVSNIRFTTGLELTNGLGKELAAVAAPAPLVHTKLVDGAAFAVGVGIDAGKALDFAGRWAEVLAGRSYQCQMLTGINRAASELITGMQFVPPAVRQFHGAAAIVTGVEQDAATTRPTPPDGSLDDDAFAAGGNDTRARGFAALGSLNPAATFEVLKAFIAPLATVILRPDGPPVALPAIEGVDFLEGPMLVMSNTAIGLTSGEAPEDLSRALNETAGADAQPLVVVAWDYQKIAEISQSEPVASDLAPLMGAGLTTMSLRPGDKGIFVQVSMPTPAPPQ